MHAHKLETILVAIDFSEQSELVLAHAMRLCEAGDAELTLLWVSGQPYRAPVGTEDFAAAPEIDALLAAARAEAAAELEALAERARQRGLTVTTRIEAGHPDEVITGVAESQGAALVVIGTRGNTGVKRWLLGSVAEKVVRTSTGNVLVTRGEARPFERILVATDFSPASERALQMAIALAPAEVHIDLLYALDDPPLSLLRKPEPGDGPLATLRDQMAHDADALGAAMVQRYAATGRALRFVRAAGSPRDVIHEQLESGSYDLVALGSHGDRRFRRFLLGSVVEDTVRHAPCSVLVTPVPDIEDR